jgi:hypothetical protein
VVLPRKRQCSSLIGLMILAAILIVGFIIPDVSSLLYLRSLDRLGDRAAGYVSNAMVIPNSRGAWRGDARLAQHAEGAIAWRNIRLTEGSWRERSRGCDPVEVVLGYIPGRFDIPPVVDDELADRLKSARVSVILSAFWGGLVFGFGVIGALVNLRRAGVG